MTRATKAKAKGGSPATAVAVEQRKDESEGKALARTIMGPYLRHGLAASVFAGSMLGTSAEKPGILDYAKFVKGAATKAEGGDLTMASQMLAAQAITLDSMFTELARRAALNMGEYINAAERYGRLALKAQSNCRATLETLAKLHQPREQIVKHVHVSEGGQAVVADEFHHHTGGAENAKTIGQSHAAGTPIDSNAMLGKNTTGNGVPVACRQRKKTMQNARRD